MTAKEYLRQIRHIDQQLKQLLDEWDELKKAQTFLKSPQVEGDRVQTSPSGDPPWMGHLIKMDELKLKIADKYEELFTTRLTIVGQINSLSDSRYTDVLMKRYVEYKRFDRIAREMHYTPDYILHLHGMALKEIQRIL